MRCSSRLYDTARYGSLLAAGACTFLGLVLLMPLAGVTWHSNYQYSLLDAYVISPSADLMIWVVAFALSTFPFYASVKRDRNILHDPLLTFSNLVLPLASIMMGLWSYKAAVAGLAISGPIVAYGLARRSPRLLRIASRDAFRIVAAVTLTCLAGLSAISILGMAMGGENVIRVLSTAATLSNETLSNPWLRAMALDLEFFFLLRPALPSLIAILVIVAVLAVLSDTPVDPVKPLRKLFAGSLGRRSADQRYGSSGSSRGRLVSIVAAVLVVGAIPIGACVTLYPYLFGNVDGLLGSDTWYYLGILRDTRQPLEVVGGSKHPLFTVFLLCLRWATGASPFYVVMYSPLVLSVLLSLSSYALVRQGTKDTLFASFAALLSVVSSATTIGLGAAIFANWFALALVNLFFALLLRAQMVRAITAIVLASVFSLLVLIAHPVVWGAVIAMIAIQGLSVVLASYSKRSEFKDNVVPLLFVIALDALFLCVASTQIPTVRLELGAAVSESLSALNITNVTNLIGFLDGTIDYGRNRLDATVLVLFSIIGIADTSLLPRPFRRILGSMMIVPVFFTLLAPTINWTWRGLYLLPTCLGAALGTRSIVHRVNASAAGSRRESILNFVFSGSLLGYVFLSSLAWTLRATLLLIETSVRSY